MNKKVLLGIAIGAGVLLTAAAAAVVGGIAYTNKKLDNLVIDSVDDTNE